MTIQLFPILGMDFLKTFNCQHDFQTGHDCLIARPENFGQEINIPIIHSIKNNLIVPARPEVKLPNLYKHFPQRNFHKKPVFNRWYNCSKHYSIF